MNRTVVLILLTLSLASLTACGKMKVKLVSNSLGVTLTDGKTNILTLKDGSSSSILLYELTTE